MLWCASLTDSGLWPITNTSESGSSVVAPRRESQPLFSSSRALSQSQWIPSRGAEIIYIDPRTAEIERILGKIQTPTRLLVGTKDTKGPNSHSLFGIANKKVCPSSNRLFRTLCRGISCTSGSFPHFFPTPTFEPRFLGLLNLSSPLWPW